MHPRRQRLSRTTFPTILGSGKRVSSPHFRAIVASGSMGYAVVVPKKVARLSVTRHKIKRRTLAALQTLGLSGSAIIYPVLAVKDSPLPIIREELGRLLRKDA